MKRKPPRSQVYRNARYVPIYPGCPDCHLVGDEIERPLKDKYRVLLKKSMRVNGCVKKKQWHIIILSYWDIVDDFSRYENPFDFDALDIWEGAIYDRIQKCFPEATPEQYQTYCDLISTKLTPIKDEIITDYLQSEEYHVHLENERLKEQYKRQHQQENKRQSAGGDYDYTSSSHHFQFSLNRQSLTDSERELAQKLIQVGYKKLAAKYHPDVGGDKQTMQQLNLLKEKLLQLL